MLTVSPVSYNGGTVWSVMTGIHGALQAIAYGLLVLFFAAGVVKTCGSFVEVKKPEHALKLFVRFVLAKAAVDFGMDLMLAVFNIVQGMISRVISASGASGIGSTTLPQELIDTINACGFWESIPLWAVTLIGSLLITVLSFVMVLTVYGRMFSLWMYAAIAPVPLAAFAGEPTSSVGKNFLRSYAGVCLQGVVIALACIIFSALATSAPTVAAGTSAITGRCGRMSARWRSICWCWWGRSKGATGSSKRLWGCNAATARRQDKQEPICRMKISQSSGQNTANHPKNIWPSIRFYWQSSFHQL